MPLNQLSFESSIKSVRRIGPPADTRISLVEPGEVSNDKKYYYSNFFKVCRPHFEHRNCKDHLEPIEKLLKQGVDPNKDDSFVIRSHRNKKLALIGCKERRPIKRPLDYAIMKENLPLVKLLIKYGAVPLRHTLTPFVKAMLLEDLFELQKIAQTDGDMKTGLGTLTPFKIATKLMDWDYIYLLLEKGCVSQEELSVELKGPKCIGPWKSRFCMFSAYNEVDRMRSKNGFLEYGRTRESFNKISVRFMTQLYEFIMVLGYGTKRFKKLPSLMKVTQPNRNFWSRTHLCNAIVQDDANLVKFLLQQPLIDVNKGGGRATMFTAIRFENLEIIDLLLSDKRIDLNCHDLYDGTLLSASWQKVKRLEKKIANLNFSKFFVPKTDWARDERYPETHAYVKVYDYHNKGLMRKLGLPYIPLGYTKFNKDSDLKQYIVCDRLKKKVDLYLFENKYELFQKELKDDCENLILLRKIYRHIKEKCTKAKTFYFNSRTTCINNYPKREDRENGQELWIACFNNDIPMVQHLILNKNIDFFYTLTNSFFFRELARQLETDHDVFSEYIGYSALHVASRKGFTEIVQLLLSHSECMPNIPMFRPTGISNRH